MRLHDAIKNRDLPTKEVEGVSPTSRVMWHAAAGQDRFGNDFSMEALSTE